MTEDEGKVEAGLGTALEADKKLVDKLNLKYVDVSCQDKSSIFL